MSTTASDAVAAPAEVSLGGKTYTVAPLTIYDLGRLERWLRQEQLNLDYEASTHIPDAEDRMQARAEAREAAADIRVGTLAFDVRLRTPGAALRIVGIALERHHPDLGDPKAVSALASSMDELVAAADVVSEISFPTDDPKPTAPETDAMTETGPNLPSD